MKKLIKYLALKYSNLRFLIYFILLLLSSIFLLTSIFLVLNLDPRNQSYANLSILIIIILIWLSYFLYEKNFKNPPLTLLLSINLQIMGSITITLFFIYILIYQKSIGFEFQFSLFSLLLTILGILYSVISDNFSKLNRFKVANITMERKRLELINRMYSNIHRTNKHTRRKNHRRISKTKQPPQV